MDFKYSIVIVLLDGSIGIVKRQHVKGRAPSVLSDSVALSTLRRRSLRQNENDYGT